MSLKWVYDEAIRQAKGVISKCIEFDRCRYDDSLIPSDFSALKAQNILKHFIDGS
jgi:uncharacterized protein YbbK (DUF523 family)